MGAGEGEWEGVRQAWDEYREVVGAWLEVSPDPEADPALVDGLTHHVIAQHNAWSDRLGVVLEATHRH